MTTMTSTFETHTSIECALVRPMANGWLFMAVIPPIPPHN